METKPPLPPFTTETARQKVRMAEDAWNTRDPDRVVLVYTEDTHWRNRVEFPVGREQVREFLVRKWSREMDYRLIKELWACSSTGIVNRQVNTQRLTDRQYPDCSAVRRGKSVVCIGQH